MASSVQIKCLGFELYFKSLRRDIKVEEKDLFSYTLNLYVGLYIRS